MAPKLGVERKSARRGVPAPGPVRFDQARCLRRAPRPGLRPGAVALPLVRAVRGVVRLAVADLGRSVVVFRLFPDGSVGGLRSVVRLHAFFRCFGFRVACQVGEQGLEGGGVHGFQAREGQGRLVAYGQEDHRVAGRCGLQLVVQQPFVEDADVFGREIGKVHGNARLRAAPALANADRGAGEQAQDPVNVPVRHRGLALEARVLVNGQRLGEAVRFARGPARGEQFAAVILHRQVREMGPLPHEPEQRQDPRPSAVALGQGAGVDGVAFQSFEQAVQAVALVVEGVVPGQQVAGLREQDHHQPHGHPAGGAVDVRGSRRGAPLLQRVAVARDQYFHRFAHPLAKRLGQFRLSLAGVADGLQERRRGVFGRGSPEFRAQQGAQRRYLRGELAFLEPQVQVPFAPRVVVQSGEQQPPLASVGHQREMLAAGAQPAEHLADHEAAPADAQAFPVVQEHRQPPAAPALPQMAGFDGLSRNGASSPLRRHPAAAGPDAGGGVQPADPFQHEGDELRGVAIAVQQRSGALAQLPSTYSWSRGTPGESACNRAPSSSSPPWRRSPQHLVRVWSMARQRLFDQARGPARSERLSGVGMKAAPCRTDIEVIPFST